MEDSRGIYSAMEPLDHMLEFEALRRMVIHRKARHPASGIREESMQARPRARAVGRPSCTKYTMLTSTPSSRPPAAAPPGASAPGQMQCARS